MLFVFSPKCKYIVLGSSLWLRKFDDGGMFFGLDFFFGFDLYDMKHVRTKWI